MAVSCVGGGNRSTRRKPPICHRQTLSHNAVSSTPSHERGSNSQLKGKFGIGKVLTVLEKTNKDTKHWNDNETFFVMSGSHI